MPVGITIDGNSFESFKKTVADTVKVFEKFDTGLASVARSINTLSDAVNKVNNTKFKTLNVRIAELVEASTKGVSSNSLLNFSIFARNLSSILGKLENIGATKSVSPLKDFSNDLRKSIDKINKTDISPLGIKLDEIKNLMLEVEVIGKIGTGDSAKILRTITSLLTAVSTLSKVNVRTTDIQKPIMQLIDAFNILRGFSQNVGTDIIASVGNISRSILALVNAAVKIGSLGDIDLSGINRFFSFLRRFVEDTADIKAIFNVFASFSQFDTKKILDFGIVIRKLTTSFRELADIDLDDEKIEKIWLSMRTLGQVMQEFAPTRQTGRLSFFKNFINQFKGVESLFEKFARFGKTDIEGIRRVANSIRDIILSIESIRKIDFKAIDIGSFKKFMDDYTSIFVSRSRFRNLLSGNFVNAIIGQDSLLNRISKFDIGNLEKFGTLGKAIGEMVKAIETMFSLEIKKRPSEIKEIQNTINSFIRIFTGRQNIISKAISGVKGIFGFSDNILQLTSKISSIKIEKFSGFTKSIEKLFRVLTNLQGFRLDNTNMSKFLNSMSLLVKGVAKIANDVKRVNTKSFEALANSMSKFVNIATKNVQADLKINIDDAMYKAGKSGGKSLEKGFRDAVEARSPSRVFERIGRDLISGLIRGIKNTIIKVYTLFRDLMKNVAIVIRSGMSILQRAFSGIKNAVSSSMRGVLNIINKVNPFSSFTSSLNRLKQHFVFTFGDLTNIARRFFRTFSNSVIGVAIEFEDAFAGVVKTLDTSSIFQVGGETAVDAALEGIRISLKGLASDADSLVASLPNAFTQLTTIAEAAGQLGIAADDIASFSEAVGILGIAAPQLDTQEASFFLSRFSEQFDTSEFDRIVGSFVALGNSFATTEPQMINVANRMMGIARNAGFTASETLGLATAIASTGLRAEGAANSFNRLIGEINLSIANNEMEAFARISGLTTREFKRQWEEDIMGTFQRVVEGIGQVSGIEFTTLLQELELEGEGFNQLLSLLSSGAMRDAIALSNSEFKNFGDTIDSYNAAQLEASKRSETTRSALNTLKNVFQSLNDTIGRITLAPYRKFILVIADIGRGIEEFLINNPEIASAMLATLGAAVGVATTAFLSFAGVFTILSPLMAPFIVGITALTGLFSILIVDADGVGLAFSNLVKKITELISTLFSIVRETFGLLRDLFDVEFFRDVLSPIEALFTSLTNFVDNVLQKLRWVLSQIKELHRLLIGDETIKDIVKPTNIQDDEQRNSLLKERERILARINKATQDGFVESNFRRFKVGDTISAIAQETGFSIRELLEFNNLLAPGENIQRGLERIIPMRGINIPVRISDEEAKGLQDRLNEINDQLKDSLPAPIENIISRISGSDAEADALRQRLFIIKSDIDNIKTAFENAFNAFGRLFDGIPDAAWNDLKTNLRTIRDSVLDIVSQIFSPLSLDERFGPDQAMHLEQFARMERRNQQPGISVFDRMFGIDSEKSTMLEQKLSAIKEDINSIKTDALLVGTAFKEIAKGDVTTGFNILDLALRNIKDSFSKIASDIISFFSGGDTQMSEVIQVGRNQLIPFDIGGKEKESVVTRIFMRLKDIFEEAFARLSIFVVNNFPVILRTALFAAINAFASIPIGLASALASIVENDFLGIGTFLNKTTIGKGISNILTTFGDIINSLFSGFNLQGSENKGETILQGISDFITNLATGIATIIVSAFNEIPNIVSGIVSLGKTFLDNVIGPILSNIFNNLFPNATGNVGEVLSYNVGKIVGKLSADLGKAFVELFRLAIISAGTLIGSLFQRGEGKRGLIQAFLEDVISPFIQGVVDGIKGEDNILTVREGIEALIGAAFGLVVVKGIFGAKIGIGIIGSLKAGLAAIAASQIAIAGLAVALGGFVFLALTDENFRNSLGDGLREAFNNLSDGGFDAWIQDFEMRLTNFFVWLAIEIKYIFDEVTRTLNIALLDIQKLPTELIPEGLRTGEQQLFLDELIFQRTILENEREIARGVRQGMFEDFGRIGTFERGFFLPNAPVDDYFVRLVQRMVDNVKTKVDTGEISLNEAISTLIEKGIIIDYETAQGIFGNDVVPNFLRVLFEGFGQENINRIIQEVYPGSTIQEAIMGIFASIFGGNTATAEDVVKAQDIFQEALNVGDFELVFSSVQFFSENGIPLPQAMLAQLRSQMSDEFFPEFMKLDETDRQNIIKSIDTLEIGSNIMTGIVNGLTKKFPNFIENIGTTINSFKNKWLDELEMRSPSKWMEKRGDDIIQGLIDGFEGMKSSLEDIVDDIIDIVKRVDDSIREMLYNIQYAFTIVTPIASFGLFILREQIIALNIVLSEFNEILKVTGNMLSGISNIPALSDITNAANAGTGNRIPVPAFGGGLQFGGLVAAGNVYEILEGGIPFELFRTSGRTFLLPNSNGMVMSPMSGSSVSPVPGSYGGGSSIINSTVSYDISVPVTFESVGSDISNDELNRISERITGTVQKRIADGMRETTLTDRLNTNGVT